MDNAVNTANSNYYYFTGDVTQNALFSNNINLHSLFSF